MFLRIDKTKLKCPTCGSPTKPATAISGAESDNWLKCVKCDTYINTYIPLPHQYMIHKDPSRTIGIFGGYGSGKTNCNIQDTEKHILITQSGRTLIGAKIQAQYEQTIQAEFERDFPIDFVSHINKQKSYIDFINNHRLLYRPLYDQEILRSLNLTSARIVEASAVDFEEFTQLQTRLRNTAAISYLIDPTTNQPIYDDEGNPIIKSDWRRFIIESNPDAGWIRNEFLLRSNYIYFHGEEQPYYVDPQRVDRYRSSHIIPTSANIYLPKDFQEVVGAGKPAWWRNRYFHGSFDYSEGLVYPNALRIIKKAYQLPNYSRYVVAMDYGITDNTHFLFGALHDKKLSIFHEIVVNQMNVKEIATVYKRDLLKLIPLTALYRIPVMDGRSYNQPQKDDVKKTLSSLFLDEGLLFNPAKMDLNARIMRTNTLIELDQIEIFDTCPALIKEILDYKFPEKSLDQKSPDKPVDVRNHGVNALEFMTMELPPDLSTIDLAAYDENGRALIGNTIKKTNNYDPFTDNNQTTDNPFFNSIYGGFN